MGNNNGCPCFPRKRLSSIRNTESFLTCQLDLSSRSKQTSKISNYESFQSYGFREKSMFFSKGNLSGSKLENQTDNFISFKDVSFPSVIKNELYVNENLIENKDYLSILLNNVFNLIMDSYADYLCIFDEPNNDIQLKIYLRSYLDHNKNRINIFRTQYIAPVKAKDYLEFANNINAQKSIDSLSDKYYSLKEINEKTNIYYLLYKKTLISSPRDFLYLKTFDIIKSNNKDFYCILGKSIDSDLVPLQNNIIRCNIINSGYVIEEIDDFKCLIRTYSEFDFKINLPLWIVKNFSSSETKKFIERSINKLNFFVKNKNHFE